MLQEGEKKGFLSYLPVSFFGSSMGLSGMCAAWNAMSHLSKICSSESQEYMTCVIPLSFTLISDVLSLLFALLSLIAFIALSVGYSLKVITSFENFKQEFLAPLTRPFFATISISLLLLPFAFARLGIPEIISLIVWGIGAISMLILSVHIVQFWICKKLELSDITPAWIIPVVGLLDLPLALPLFSSTQSIAGFSFLLSTFCLAVGLSFTIVLCTLIFARIVFFAKLPDKLMPTLVIFLAPFGAGVGTYTVLIFTQSLMIADSLTFAMDSIPYALLLIGLFLFFALLPQITQVKQCCPFRISWWAISFPLAALCIASIKINIEALGLIMPLNTMKITLSIFSLSLIVFVTVIFIWLIMRTLFSIFKGELSKLA